MKKIALLVILLGVFGIQFAAPEVAFPATNNDNRECDTVFCGPGLNEGAEMLRPELRGSGIEITSTLTQAILYWIRLLLKLAGILAFVAFVWAGFLFLTSFANEENHDKAKKILLYTAIGIIVILFSYALTNLFINAEIS